MSAETIKSFVERKAAEGRTSVQTWRLAAEHFPHNCVSLSYVMKIHKAAKLRPFVFTFTPQRK